MAKLFANSGDLNQTPRSAASDLGLHCLPITLIQVSRLQWVNYMFGSHRRPTDSIQTTNQRNPLSFPKKGDYNARQDSQNTITSKSDFLEMQRAKKVETS